METTIIHWGYIGMMEKKMETIIVFFKGLRFRGYGSTWCE